MESEMRMLEVGNPAPDLGALGMDEPRGGLEVGDEPTVLAFLPSAHQLFSSDEQREVIRAELRGLGAALLVLSPRSLWCFRPDDETQMMKRVPELAEAAVRGAFPSHGVPIDADDDGSGLRALFVIDGKRIVRFAHVSAPDEVLTLDQAMRSAGRAMLKPAPPGSSRTGASRREFLVMSLVAGFAVAVADGCARPPPVRDSTSLPREELDVTLNVNGHPERLRLEPRVSLLDALRENLGLTGTKKGCDHGQCGACTVLIDGRRVNACLTLAVMAEGAAITTIEGLGTEEALHPMQAAFVAEDALQCGYCTPGQIMSAVGLVTEGHAHNDDDIREAMSGNICRCGAYPNIVTAIRRARKEME